jgi:hypothetical protein
VFLQAEVASMRLTDLDFDLQVAGLDDFTRTSSATPSPTMEV